MLWQIVWFLIGAVCLGYYGALCSYLRKWDATFSRFWLAAGTGSLILEFLYVQGIMPDMFWRIFCGMMSIVLIVMSVTVCLIVKNMIPKKGQTYDYLIVLGAQVRGTKITDSLRRRLEKSFYYLEFHEDVKVIVSGGQGKGEEITEARAMAEYLIARGIDETRIFREEASRTTMENLRFSARLLEKETAQVAIVSSNFHLYRACRMAKRLGYRHVSAVAASCHPLLFANYMVREVLAVWKLWILG